MSVSASSYLYMCLYLIVYTMVFDLPGFSDINNANIGNEVRQVFVFSLMHVK